MRTVWRAFGVLAILAAGGLAHGAPVVTSLTQHWQLDETSGTTAFSSAGGADGTFVAGAATLDQVGMVGTAYKFTPTSSAFGVNVGAGVFPATGDFTFSTWFKDAVNDNAIFGSGGATGADNGRAIFDISSGRVRMLGAGSGWSHITGNTVVTGSSDWRHLTVTRTGNDWMFWIDGVADLPIPAVRNYTVAQNQVYGIGSRGDWWHPATNWTGLLDDVGVWHRGLSAPEIAAVHAMGRFEGIDLQHQGIDQLLAAHQTQGNAVINGNTWSYTTDLPGNQGATGVSEGLRYVVLGNGTGMAGKALVSTSLTQHWRLDETTGNQAANSVSTGATGTISSGVQLDRPGIIGTAYDINSTAGVAFAPALIPATGDFTVSMWLKDAQQGKTFFGSGGSSGDNRLQLDVREDGRSRILSVSGSDHIVANTTVTDLDDWYHYTVTRSGDDWMIWIDGMEDMDSPATRTNPVIQNSTFYLGSRGGTVPITNWPGLIDDVGIWDRALSPQEIAAVHALGLFEGLDAQHEGIDALLAAYDSQSSTMIDGNPWLYTTDLDGPLGAIGGSLAEFDAFVVLGADGSGMLLIPEPGTWLLLLSALVCAAMMRRRAG